MQAIRIVRSFVLCSDMPPGTMEGLMEERLSQSLLLLPGLTADPTDPDRILNVLQDDLQLEQDPLQRMNLGKALFVQYGKSAQSILCSLLRSLTRHPGMSPGA